MTLITKPQKRVLLAALSNWPGIGLIPSLLAEAGFEVTVLAHPGYFSRRGHGIHRAFDAPEATQISVYVDQLKAHLEKYTHYYDWVIPADDPLLYELVLRAKQEPWINSILPATADHLVLLLSKANFQATAHHLGLPVPPTQIFQNKAELFFAAETLPYPLMVRGNRGFGGLANAYIPSRDLLESTINAHDKLVFPIVAQPFITAQAGTTAALFEHGQPVAWFSFLTPRPDEHQLVNSSQMELCVFDPEQIEHMLFTLGTHTGYHGLGGIDFLYQHDAGKLYLMEMHARPLAQTWAGKLAGVDFAQALQLWSKGKRDLFEARQNPGSRQSLTAFDEVEAMMAPLPPELKAALRSTVV